MKEGTVMGTEAEGRGGEAEGGPGRAEVTDHGARPKPAGAPAPPQRTGRAEGHNPFPVTCRRLWRWVLSSGQTMRTAEGGRGSGLGGIIPEAGRGRARAGFLCRSPRQFFGIRSPGGGPEPTRAKCTDHAVKSVGSYTACGAVFVRIKQLCDGARNPWIGQGGPRPDANMPGRSPSAGGRPSADRAAESAARSRRVPRRL